jgi:hypothetical protein
MPTDTFASQGGIALNLVKQGEQIERIGLSEAFLRVNGLDQKDNIS